MSSTFWNSSTAFNILVIQKIHKICRRRQYICLLSVSVSVVKRKLKWDNRQTSKRQPKTFVRGQKFFLRSTFSVLRGFTHKKGLHNFEHLKGRSDVWVLSEPTDCEFYTFRSKSFSQSCDNLARSERPKGVKDKVQLGVQRPKAAQTPSNYKKEADILYNILNNFLNLGHWFPRTLVPLSLGH